MTLPENGGWGTGTGLGALPSRLSCLIIESFHSFSLIQEAEEGKFGVEEPCRKRMENAVPHFLSVASQCPCVAMQAMVRVGWWLSGQRLSSLATHKPYFSQCYRDLALVSRDGMNIVLNKINQLLMEKYLKLQDTCRTQVRPERKVGKGDPGVSLEHVPSTHKV